MSPDSLALGEHLAYRATVDAPPPDYTSPVLVYLDEEPNTEGEIAQIGGLFTEEEAQKLLQRLNAEGRTAYINMVPIHQRAADHEYDR
jgi:cell division septation protein DedD